jgi:hypothetical protein
MINPRMILVTFHLELVRIKQHQSELTGFLTRARLQGTIEKSNEALQNQIQV